MYGIYDRMYAHEKDSINQMKSQFSELRNVFERSLV